MERPNKETEEKLTWTGSKLNAERSRAYTMALLEKSRQLRAKYTKEEWEQREWEKEQLREEQRERTWEDLEYDPYKD